MIASLPQLKQLDGMKIENSERILAMQVYSFLISPISSPFHAEERGGGGKGGQGGGEVQGGEAKTEGGA